MVSCKAPVDSSVDDDLTNLFTEAKRHFALDEFECAAEKFTKLCQMLAEKYGETAPECASAYYYYGSTLLEIGRTENKVLGPATEAETPDTDDDDEEEGEEETPGETNEEESKEKNAEEASPSKESGENVDAQTNNDAKNDDEDPEQSSTKETESAEKSSEDDVQAEDDDEEKSPADVVDDTAAKEGDDEEEEEDDDPSSLQLAWEMLQLAKAIYSKSEERADRLQLASTLYRLGEVCLEDDKLSLAVAEFSACLDIQMELLEPTDRQIAATHFQLGATYACDSQPTKAVEYFRSSQAVSRRRLDKLSAGLAAMSESDRDEVQKEIASLQSVIADIDVKVCDFGVYQIGEAETECVDEAKVRRMIREQLSGFHQAVVGMTDGASTSSANPGPSGSSAPPTDLPASNGDVHDISTSAIRRKKRSNEPISPVGKKARLEDEAVNGEGDAVEATE